MSPPSTNYVKERVGNLAVFGGLLSFKKINTRNVTSYRDFLSTFVQQLEFRLVSNGKEDYDRRGVGVGGINR